MSSKFLKHLLLWALIIALTAYIFMKFRGEQPAPEIKSWDTYEKKEEVVSSHPSTSEEKKKAKVVGSIPPAKPEKRNFPTYNDRRVINPQKTELDWQDIEFSNEIHSEWKDRLANRLLRNKDEETKVLIRHKQSVIKVLSNKARYMEVVVVTFIGADNRPQGYTAFVDSESGKVLQTWGPTRYEDLSRKRMK